MTSEFVIRNTSTRTRIWQYKWAGGFGEVYFEDRSIKIQTDYQNEQLHFSMQIASALQSALTVEPRRVSAFLDRPYYFLWVSLRPVTVPKWLFKKNVFLSSRQAWNSKVYFNL